ncbi:MAG: HPr family phosphocarrier protein [Alistipes finegoldii]
MLALLSLGLKCGTEIEICAEGGDEAAAVKPSRRSSQT